jgi:hypothetical protein
MHKALCLSDIKEPKYDKETIWWQLY